MEKLIVQVIFLAAILLFINMVPLSTLLITALFITLLQEHVRII